MFQPEMSPPHKIRTTDPESWQHTTRFEAYEGLDPYDEVKLDPFFALEVQHLEKQMRDRFQKSCGISRVYGNNQEISGIGISLGSDFVNRPDTVTVTVTNRLWHDENGLQKYELNFTLYPNGQGIRQRIYSQDKNLVVSQTVLDERFLQKVDMPVILSVFQELNSE